MPEDEDQPQLRCLLDENLPTAFMGWLRNRRANWEIFHVLEVGLKGSSDQEVFRWAQDNQCLIVTFDRDFGDRRSFAASQHYGIIHLRVRPTTLEETRAAFTRLFAQLEESDLRGALVVIARETIRVRPGGTSHP